MGRDLLALEASVRIKIKNRFVLLLFGWGMFPEYAEAEHGLWWQWFKRRK